MTEIALGIVVFSTVVLALAALILAARRLLVGSGEVLVRVNATREFRAPVGRKLLAVLAGEDINLAQACGGRGTCGQCRLRVLEGTRPPLAVETALLPGRELADGMRLACQFSLRGDVGVEVPAAVLGVRRLTARVHSTRSVSTLMKEIVLELPGAGRFDFRAGAYVQVFCPPHETELARVAVDARFETAWQGMGLRRLRVASGKPEVRAYSLASEPGAEHPALIVRLATPPPGADVPPGRVSSWIFSLAPGDAVEIAGPYGDFHAEDAARERILIGGGAGMAPLRSILRDQLLNRASTVPTSFWYGARNLDELFYVEEFDGLAADHRNFNWCAALSEPRPEDDWQGETGFIHEVVLRRHLAHHPAPEDADYYLCGPPLMIRAVRAMLDSLGVDEERIHFDDFGA